MLVADDVTLSGSHPISCWMMPAMRLGVGIVQHVVRPAHHHALDGAGAAEEYARPRAVGDGGDVIAAA